MQTFPFGQPVTKVEQKDRTPKQVFILGVYASAVHAAWYSISNKIRVQALAIASEPEIFWRGENAEDIVNNISIPEECGYLLPAKPQFNGPSGKILDSHFLSPLGVTRSNVWLCDLLPFARMNVGQESAIRKHYNSFVKKGLVPPVTLEKVPNTFANNQRRREIVEELFHSKASLIVTLGDKPIKEFLSPYLKDINTLSSSTERGKKYGIQKSIIIEGQQFEVLTLVHPRQAGQLGRSSQTWSKFHMKWIKRRLTRRSN